MENSKSQGKSATRSEPAPNMTPTDALAILIAAWCIYHQVDALRQRATLKKKPPL